jgi:hypothetical protein
MLPAARACGTSHARHPTTRLICLAQQAVRFIHHQILQVLQREPGRALHVRDQAAACRGGRERPACCYSAAAAHARHAPPWRDDEHIDAAGRARANQCCCLGVQRAFARGDRHVQAHSRAQGLEDGGHLRGSEGQRRPQRMR